MPTSQLLTKHHRSTLVQSGAALAILLSIPMTGCSSSNTWATTSTNKNTSQGTNQNTPHPVEAYNQRSRAEALELFAQASHLHEQGLNEQAMAKYKESITKDNTIFAAWNNMGQLLMEQKNYADSVAAYKIASDLQRTDPRPEYNIGLAYQTIGWGEESYTHFQIALERDPNYLPALRGAVRSAEMLGIGDQSVLEHIRNGQLRETDPQWRQYFDRQRFRVEKVIKEST